ncbi:GNAT family N-acetyltransferase [Sphingomonas sp.]|uniref:GNAT family N-acetyltransferase n=1 Tax=Sphingomonas sp. TaxID=28214 RepID=UPI00286A910C|nr:GNAT family N-acetyltransferase [Sphingomonas sp.]
MIFTEGDLDSADVVALLDLHLAAMKGSSPPEACHVLPTEALRHPAIRFFSAWDENGMLLGIGALKMLAPGHGEIKSMRTVPEALGRGVGGAILAHIIQQARAAGIGRISLETGSTAEFAGALRLYERDGFTPCEPFGGYAPSPFTRFFSRTI